MERMDAPALGVRRFAERLEGGTRLQVLPAPERRDCLVYCAAPLGRETRVFEAQGAAFPVPRGTAEALAARFAALIAEAAPPGAETEARTADDLCAGFLLTPPETLHAALRAVLTAALTLGSAASARGWEVPVPPGGEAPDPETLCRCAHAAFRPETLSLCVLGGGEPGELAALARLLLPEGRAKPSPGQTGAGEARFRRRIAEELARALPPEQLTLTERVLTPYRRGCYGRRVMALDDRAATAEELCRGTFLGYDYLSFPAVYRAVTPDEVRAARAELSPA